MNPTVSDRMTSRPDPGSITRLQAQRGAAAAAVKQLPHTPGILRDGALSSRDCAALQSCVGSVLAQQRKHHSRSRNRNSHSTCKPRQRAHLSVGSSVAKSLSSPATAPPAPPPLRLLSAPSRDDFPALV
jgi:hypothetical protein